MSDAFKEALELTLRWEGGYSNHPNDPGGETYRGITRKNHPNWAGWPIVDGLMPFNGAIFHNEALEQQIAAFYHTNYWKPAGCEEIAKVAPKTAAAVFDMAVHSGVSRAVKELQRIVGSHQDGVFGEKTQLAFLAYTDRSIATPYVHARARFLDRLVAHNSGLRVFRRGWNNRVGSLVKFIEA